MRQKKTSAHLTKTSSFYLPSNMFRSVHLSEGPTVCVLSSGTEHTWRKLSGECVVCFHSSRGKHWLITRSENTHLCLFCIYWSLLMILIKNTQTKQDANVSPCFCHLFICFFVSSPPFPHPSVRISAVLLFRMYLNVWVSLPGAVAVSTSPEQKKAFQLKQHKESRPPPPPPLPEQDRLSLNHTWKRFHSNLLLPSCWLPATWFRW